MTDNDILALGEKLGRVMKQRDDLLKAARVARWPLQDNPNRTGYDQGVLDLLKWAIAAAEEEVA